MALAKRDSNRVTTMMGVDSLTGLVPLNLVIDETTGRLLVTSIITGAKASASAVTTVAASASSVTLLSANTSRLGAVIVNDSSAVLYIKFGTTASTSSYTIALGGSGSAPFEAYEIPFGYTGRIDGISASATGNYRITELT